MLLGKNPINHDRAKHIDIIYHHIRDDIESGKIDITYIPSADKLADLFTKSLSADSHERLTAKLGLSRGG